MRNLFLHLILLCSIAYAKHHRHRVPLIDVRGAEQLMATIREDESILNTVPDLAIVAESGPVCKYQITSNDGINVPFEAEVIDRYTGNAVIRVKESSIIDCKTGEYSFQIVAVRCDDESAVSEPVRVKVTIKDTNNHQPQFQSPWFTFAVEEGKIHDEIGILKATDADCGHPYGEICEYEITNGLKNFPFAINNQGVLKNTQPLNYTQTKSYILTVIAHDCGMRQSKSVLVTVNVNQACVQSLANMNDRVDYGAGSGSRLILPEITANICEKESKCEATSVTAIVQLKVKHVSNGCSRENIFNNNTIQSCGLNARTISLFNEEKEKDGTNFDGNTNAIIVPTETFSGLIPDKFAFSFSMKHDKGTKEELNNKQNILCESDDFNMNRHHFSVYVRHCKLEVVLRREAGSTAEFKAAEWRWGIPQICDNEWHSYSLLFNGVDDVEIMVDGSRFRADERNPEILDDWPLHKTKLTKTKMVIGACWHGRQQSMAQFFKGSLSSVRLLAGATESISAIECAHKCPEQLQYTGIDELSEGQSATFSSDESTLTLKATNTQDISNMLRRVAYVNTQSQPTIGHRSWSVDTNIQCKNGKQITLPVSKGYIFVQKPADPVISISGTALLSADHHSVKIGTPMLPEIQMAVVQTNSDGEVKDITSSAKFDYCKVHLKPSRDMDLEYFSFPASLVAILQIDFEHDKEGLLLRGSESVKGYKQVLEKIHYFNTRPDNYSKRIYAVQCAMMKGKILSNEFIVTMTLTPPTTSEPATSTESLDSLEMIERHFEPAFDQLGSSRLQSMIEMDLPRPKALLSHHGYDVGQGAIAGGAVAVVVVVCVGFLLILLVVGVLKMRDTPLPRKRKQKRQDDQLHWDDSGMNITVNPMDDVEKNQIEEDFSEEDESSDGEESECTFRDEDDLSDDEDTSEVLPHLEGGPRSGLEWDDDAALTTNSRSYRV